MFYVPDHTHDFPRGSLIPVDPIDDRDSLANWVLVGPQTFCHALVDDRNPERSRPVLLREGPPANERNLHRLEIARADRAEVSVLSRLGRLMPRIDTNWERHRVVG